MSFFLLLIFGIKISLSDIKSHRIHNVDLLFFFIAVALVSHNNFPRFLQFFTASLCVGFVFAALFSIGMGDVKLIALLVPLVARDYALHLTLLLICISFTSIVAAAITILKRGTISLSIPWAPSLFSGAILYLATR
jgi:Flp pilus assembly protein protease CpaA